MITIPPATTDTDDHMAPGVEGSGPVRRSSRPRSVRVPAVVAVVGLVLAAIGASIGLAPLRTPTQDCGTAAGFMIGGRLNVFVNPQSPPEGITPQDAEANNTRPCQARAADRGRISLVLVVAGTLIGLAAVFTEAMLRYRLRRRYKRGRPSAPPRATSDPLDDSASPSAPLERSPQ